MKFLILLFRFNPGKYFSLSDQLVIFWLDGGVVSKIHPSRNIDGFRYGKVIDYEHVLRSGMIQGDDGCKFEFTSEGVVDSIDTENYNFLHAKVRFLPDKESTPPRASFIHLHFEQGFIRPDGTIDPLNSNVSGVTTSLLEEEVKNKAGQLVSYIPHFQPDKNGEESLSLSQRIQKFAGVVQMDINITFVIIFSCWWV